MVGRRADGCEVFRSASSIRLIYAFETEPGTTGESDFEEGCSGISAGLERGISNVAAFVCIPRICYALTDVFLPDGILDYQVKYGSTSQCVDTAEMPDYEARIL